MDRPVHNNDEQQAELKEPAQPFTRQQKRLLMRKIAEKGIIRLIGTSHRKHRRSVSRAYAAAAHSGSVTKRYSAYVLNQDMIKWVQKHADQSQSSVDRSSVAVQGPAEAHEGSVLPEPVSDPVDEGSPEPSNRSVGE